jgi:hypothetical protein
MVLGASARAESPLPTHTGESGYLDVPSADTLGRGGATFVLDLRYLQTADSGRAFGPSPLVMSFGLGRFEAGLSLRQSGLPGDPRPATTIPAGVGKFSILEAKGKRPALAVDLFIDRINRDPVFHLRGLASTERYRRMRLSAFAGGVVGVDKPSGFTAGLALSVLGPRHTDFMGELLRQPMGPLVGLGVRWQPLPQFALAVGASYLPEDAKTWLAGVSIAFLNPPLARPSPATLGDKPPEEATARTRKRVFRTERPYFPLELRMRPLPGEAGGPARHYPGGGTVLAPPPPEAPPTSPETSSPPAAKIPTGPLILPVTRGDLIVQRPVLASLVIVPPKSRVPLPSSERKAIKQLALRAAKGEGDLVVVAPPSDPKLKKPTALIGRAVGVKRLAAKFAHLRASRVAIEVGPPEIAPPGKIMLLLLAPEKAAAAPAAGTGAAGAVEPPPASGAAAALAPPAVTPERSESAADAGTPAAHPDGGVAGATASPDAGGPADARPLADTRDGEAKGPDAGGADLGAPLVPDATPARVERPVPLPPTLKEGAAAQDQVGKTIASFQPALQECVNRALKRDPGLRGEARITLDVQSNGRVKLVRIQSKSLSGGFFEDCARRAAEAWRMPRTPQGYRVEVPLKIHIANGGPP